MREELVKEFAPNTLAGCISVSRSVFGAVEELLAQRGIVVTYETVRQWCLKSGQTYANELCRRRPRCGDKRTSSIARRAMPARTGLVLW
jgi:transposase-like protein